MKRPKFRSSIVESLESRIAPAALVTYPKPSDATTEWVPLPLGTPIQLFAGQGLSTLGDRKGSYLLFVEQGSAIVFTQDYDGDDTFDANEITGIAAGDGLRLISFVDIHGDIVTNLKETKITEERNGVIVTKSILSLSDSDNNPSNDTQGLKGDGRVLLNSSIEKVELRPLTIADLVDQNADGTVNSFDLALRQPPKSTFSIYGSIYAGRNFGADDGGLIFLPTADGSNAPTNFLPTVEAIRVGTAVNGQYYSFGVSGEYRVSTNFILGDNLSGLMSPFKPVPGANGGSINTVRSYDARVDGVDPATAGVPFSVGYLVAGNGGAGGAGGSILNVTMNSDDTSGYQLIAGNGGSGRSGGDGGSIINFSDIGSQTGLVVLSGGDGGAGSIGTGGSAGDSLFTSINIKGNVHIDMGDGGNGFTNGGNGSSLAAGIFTEPPTNLTKGLNGWGTTHYPDSSTGTYTPRLGVTNAIDFNGDNEGDFVYSTADGSVLIVMVSDPKPDTDPTDNGFQKFYTPDGMSIQGMYLNGPRNTKAMSVGDVNSDGHPDIVAASRDTGGTGDLVVFLAKYEDLNNDGILSSDEDLNHDGIDDFIGFYEPRHSTIPILSSNSFGVNDLAIGDFDGDGHAEIAVAAATRVVFMSPDMELNPITGEKEYTGQFFYDYGRKTVKVDGITFPADLKDPSIGVSPGPAVVLEATTLNTNGDTFDVVAASFLGSRRAIIIDWSSTVRAGDGDPVTINRPGGIGTYDLGVVDLNRAVPAADIDDFQLYDFTTMDINSDGIMDISAISLDDNTRHSGFINGSIGLPSGNGLPNSGAGDQAGNYIQIAGLLSMFTIRAADLDGDGSDDILVSHEVGGVVLEWVFGAVATPRFLISPAVLPASGGNNGANETTHSFADPIFDDANSLAPTNIFAVGWTDYSSVHFGSRFTIPQIDPPAFSSFSYVEYSLNLAAGDGGDALVGKGGNGGFLGGKGSLENLVDPTTGVPVIDPFSGLAIVQLNGAIQITPSVTVQLQGGNGGDGFSSGGNGGSVTGVSIYEGSALVLGHRLGAGNGGRGIFGSGGTGGSLIQNSLFAGVEFVAGNGGPGRIGGNGGSVFGSDASYDAYNSSVAVIAGDGGLGSVTGGSGGSILNFRSRVPDPRNPGEPAIGGGLLSQYLYLQAGDGGEAVIGRGGNGGSIRNSSPSIGIQLMGELIVYAGDGGVGNIGGAGGSITDFSVFPDGSSNDYMPKFVTMLGGNGGNAFTGKGGDGGGLSNVNVVGLSSETFRTNAISSDYRVYQAASRFHFNRLVAGAGGSSAGSEGGNGGGINNVITFTPLGSFAIVGGAGGDSLRKGGVGGSVSNIRTDFGASSISKALISAGAGGDASSFIINAIDTTPDQGLNAFGGRVGKGGNGGSVIGVTQRGALDPHMDIIAGDGGSTIHYGTVLDKKGYVGVGGSVRNINVVADLGNSSASAAIKSYNDILNGESYAQFVQTSLISEEYPVGVAAGTRALLDDGLGNVGVVVGAAGRNKSYVLDPDNRPTIYQSVPSKTGVNGSLEFVFARNLISAVSGSVDRIASIQSYKAVTITNNTGSDKNPRLVTVPGGAPILVADYADSNGIPTTSHEPVLEGILVDGAIVAKKFLDSKGRKIAPPINGFIR